MSSIPALLAAFENAGLEVQREGDSLTLHVAGMRRPRIARIDLNTVALPTDERQGNLACASFARGVYAYCAEPLNSGANVDSFESAAGSLLPSLEGPWFGRGFEAAAGEAAWLREFAEGVVIAVICELDDGIHVVTESQVHAWGATADRVHKATLSILFHRTSFDAAGTVDASGVERFGMRDGYDAARALLLDLWDYPLTRAGVLFSVPSSECLLLSRDTSASGLEALHQATIAELDRSDSPLSDRVFQFVDGRRLAAPVR